MPASPKPERSCGCESVPVCTAYGCRWYGRPWIDRVLLYLLHPDHPKPSTFAGCGCVCAFRDWWDRRKAR